jgi:uroporphyrin-III C-methyltransferase/precorrin-2 dehydrogenase/sirohydrochlorin ferrochelatase
VDTLPLFLNLTGQPCLVVGAGPVALRKVETLIAAGADVEVVAPEIVAPLESILLRNNAIFSQRKFNSRDVKNRLLVIAATGSAKTNKAVFDACQRAHVLINTVDDPAHCTAVFPSIVDRSPVTIAVSTGATSPSLGRRVRAQIEAMLPANYGRLARFLGERRIRVRDVIDDQTARQRFWDEVLDSTVPDLVLQGRDTDAGDAFDAKLHARAVPTGFVSLVGAGPGDPDLLTLKALRCLQRADIVYHDNLVSPGVLALCRRDAERVYVGKRRAFHSTRQE